MRVLIKNVIAERVKLLVPVLVKFSVQLISKGKLSISSLDNNEELKETMCTAWINKEVWLTV